MVKLDDLMKTMEATKDGCNHDCKNCEMFLPFEGMCYHTVHKLWKEWNLKEHERLGEVLRGGK